MGVIHRFYRASGDAFENCFYVEVSEPLLEHELRVLTWLLAETFEPAGFSRSSLISAGNGAVEVGPRLNFETAFSTNAVAICHACGLGKVARVERSRRWCVPAGTDEAAYVAAHHDRMTECLYPAPLETFETGTPAGAVSTIPLLEEGPEALRRLNREMGLGMDAWDLDFYHGPVSSTASAATRPTSSASSSRRPTANTRATGSSRGS